MPSNNPENPNGFNRARVRTLLALIAAGSLHGYSITETDVYMRHFDSERYIQQEGYDWCDPRIGALDIEQDTKIKAANDCMVSERGAVALITYSMSEERGAEYAAESTKIIADAFDGLRTPEVTAIPASSDVATRFREMNPDGCVDQEHVDRSLANIADSQMNLAGYDRIIGIAALPDCDTIEGALGVAYLEKGRRYGNVVEQVNDRGNPDWFSNINAIAHEYGHTQYLGHAGLFGDAPALMYPNGRPGQITQYDLNKFIEMNYSVYGDVSGIMGSATEADQRLLDSVQYRQLNMHEIIAGNKQDTIRAITSSGAYVERVNAKEHPYAVLSLQSPLTKEIKHENMPSEFETFDQLVFDYTVNDNNRSGAVQVLLANSISATTATIGNVYRMSGREQDVFDFHLGNQSVQLTLTADGYFAQDTTGMVSEGQSVNPQPVKEQLLQPPR